MKKDVLIGGAWPYGNYLLHIGHLSALLPGDIIARYYRATGANVIYVSGTDCHGTPITQRAKKEGKEPLEIAKHYHEEDVKTFEKALFSYDLYTKTMSDYHKKYVQEYFLDLVKNGYIYEKKELQDYCPQCDSFLSDREIKGVCPKCHGEASGEQCDNCLATLEITEVLDKHCKECNTKTIEKENKHLYFKLSSFQEKLVEFVNKNEANWRKNAVGESKKFLEMGLVDRAATRQLTWGVDVPVDSYEDKKIYVWIEAVMGYLTAARYVCEERNINFEEFMADRENLVSYYVHGKDNIPFHTVIFPALLMGINRNYQLPKVIVSSEYVNMNDEKMSKSKGNLLTINDLIDEFGVETIRYYMIQNGPEKKDVNFTKEDLINAHNKFLVGVLGNFINRNLSFVNKKFDGIIKEGTIDEEIINITKNKYKEIGTLIEKAELKQAIDEVFEYISLGNKYYDEKQPWVQVKENISEFNNITYTCVYMMANIANLVAPFMPLTSEKIKNFLGLKEFIWEEEKIAGDIKINNLELLFERIDN